MKSSRISLRLDEPCTQQWSDMTPSTTGRYCDSCEKNVIDFSQMTDNEILKFLSENKSGFCGQFRASQLDRPFVETKLNGGAKRLNSFFAGLAIAGATGSASAQSADTTNYHPVVVIDEKHPTGPVCIRQIPVDTNDLILHITVMDTLNHEAMPYANVVLQQGGVKFGGITDIDGKVTLTIPADSLQDTMMLTIRLIGYKMQTLAIHTEQRTQDVNVNLGQNEIMMLGGPMMIYEPEQPKKKKK